MLYFISKNRFPNIAQEIADKKFLLCLFLGAVIALIWTLNLMINSSY